MPYTINDDGPVLEFSLFGTLTNADLSKLGDDAWAIDGGAAIVKPRITDMRPITRLEINFTGVSDLATTRLAMRFPNAFKSAIVAPDLPHFGFARMFQTLNDHPQITIAIFPDEAVAREWLMAPGLEAPARPWAPTLAKA